MYKAKKNHIGILGIIFVIFIDVLPLWCDVYMYIDSKGVLHFTNVPTLNNYKHFIKEYPEKSLRSYSTDRYDYLINEASIKHGISFPLLKAIIKVESNFNPVAVSKAGAIGLMQIMPSNFKALKIENPFDPEENIMGGTCYFKKLIMRYNGNLTLAVAAYNAGPTRVDRSNSIPAIKETENYVKKVMQNYYLLKKNYN